MTQKEIDDLADFVLTCIMGLNVVEADAVLDEARRTLWGCGFSGKVIPEEWQGPSFTIARRLAQLPLDRVSQVLEQVRLYLWQMAFPEARPNLFGGLRDSATEV